MTLIIILALFLISVFGISYLNMRYYKREKIALLIVAANTLNKSITEETLLTEKDKLFLSYKMGLIFHKDIITFQDIKDQNKVSYYPNSDWNAWYLITFNRFNVINVEYIEEVILLQHQRNKIGIKVNP